MPRENIFSVFKKGEVQSDAIRILNWLYLVRSKTALLNIYYAQKVTTGFLKEMDSQTIQIKIRDLPQSPERKIIFTVELMNRYYYVESFLKHNKNNLYTLSYPTHLYSISRRLYNRIKPENLTMKFFTIYTPVTKSRSEENDLESSFPFLYKEITGDTPSLEIIFNMLISILKEISEDFFMRLFIRDKKSGKLELDEAEKIITKTKKTFYINNVFKTDKYFTKPNHDALTNFFALFKRIAKEQEEFNALQFIENLKTKDIQKYLLSYVMFPVSLFDEMIGYVRVQTSQFDRRYISLYDAQRLHHLGALFSHAISKISIRQSYFEDKSKVTRIVNISLSGLLMELNDIVLFHYLQKHRRIKMLIDLGSDQTEVYGEIKRFYEKDNKQYLGVLFFKSRPDDMNKLENYIYQASQKKLLSLM